MPRTMDEIYAQMERDSQTLNSAINAGAVVMLSTSFGDYQVSYVTPTLEVVCGKGFAQRTFHIANGPRLDELLEQI